jgi:hypothetical protein
LRPGINNEEWVSEESGASELARSAGCNHENGV